MAERDNFAPDELEEVFASIDPIPVQMAHDLLQESGIECFIFDANASRMLGSTAVVTTRLMVHAEDAADARERLKDLDFES